MMQACVCYLLIRTFDIRGACTTSGVGHFTLAHILPLSFNLLHESALTARLGGSVLVLVLVFTLLCFVLLALGGKASA